MCSHGRSSYTCMRCARDLLLDDRPNPSAVAGTVARSVKADLEARERYILWLEDRVRELESNKRDVAELMAGP